MINKKEASNEWRVVEVECRPDEGRMLEEKDERFALRKIVTRMFKDKAKKRRKTACEHRVQGRGRL